MNHDWQILSCPWLAHVAWLHTLAGIHRGGENTSDLYHSGPTLDQTVVSEARPCDIVCLSVCLAVLKAATCLARATAVTPRLWPRRFRSTMTPSTPCTSPELVSTSTIHLQLLFLSFIPNPLPVSLLVVSLHSYLIFRICTRAALGWGGKKNLLPPDVQQVFCFKGTTNQPTSVPTRAAFQTSNPVLRNQWGVSSTQKEDKNTSWAIIFLIFYLNVCTLVFVRYTERGSEVARCVPAQLFGSPS